MKIILPTLLMLALNLQAQTTIYALNGSYVPGSPQFTEGENCRTYSQFEPGTPFDQSQAGYDMVWDISGFAPPQNQKYCMNRPPVAEELAQYPGTTMVTANFFGFNDQGVPDYKAYWAGSNLTGYADNTMSLNYAADNVDFGPFPKVYGDLNVDTVAGTYVYGAYSGSFTGTMITEVDAYGEMALTDGTLDVIRLKTIETLQINYPGSGNVGILSKTTYRYYRGADKWPMVKSVHTVLQIPLLGLDSNTLQIEEAPIGTLSTADLHRESLAIVPNPVSGVANIVSEGSQVLSVTITDNSGKIVFTQKISPQINLGRLPAGVYFARIQTAEGSFVRKIIKE